MSTPQLPTQPAKKKRRYQIIWEAIKEKGYCEIECPRVDTQTIINMVHKEKKQDKDPVVRKKVLSNTPTEKGVIFRLAIDTSIRSLEL